MKNHIYVKAFLRKHGFKDAVTAKPGLESPQLLLSCFGAMKLAFGVMPQADASSRGRVCTPSTLQSCRGTSSLQLGLSQVWVRRKRTHAILMQSYTYHSLCSVFQHRFQTCRSHEAPSVNSSCAHSLTLCPRSHFSMGFRRQPEV